MGMFDDGLDEYAEQQVSTPTVPTSVSTAAPQQKSAELAEIEKSLEVLNGIKEVQTEMRSTMSDIKDMAAHAQDISHQLTENIKTARPIWDDLLKSFVNEIYVDEDSIERFNETLQKYADTILVKIYSRIDKSISDNVAGQFTEVAISHIQEFDKKMKESVASHNKALTDLETEYKDKIKSLQNSQGKLLKQAIEEKNRVLMPEWSFWTIILILGSVIICGVAGWLKFWRTPGNDEAMSWMVGAMIFESIYYGTMVYNHFAYKDEQKSKTDKKEENEPRIYSISLSEAVYIIILTLSASVYFVWAQLNINYSPNLLIFLLPTAWSLNFLWLVLRGLLYRIFQKD